MNKDLDIRLVKQVADSVFESTIELERVAQGVSTYVYRLKAVDQVYYLRILPEKERSFAMEVAVHEELSKLGVRVPKVIRFDERNEILGLSLMIVEEIPGGSLEDSAPESGLEEIFFAAGKELALINQVIVDGFGFLAEESDGQPGEARFRDYYTRHLDNDFMVLAESGFTALEVDNVRNVLESAGADLDRPVPHLVHGDFDASHIFHHNGSFSGIIDFGDIMGCSPFFDLGHFKLHDGKNGLGALKAGYSKVRKLTQTNLWEIDVWALFIAVRRLGMIYGRPWQHYREHLVRFIRDHLSLGY